MLKIREGAAWGLAGKKLLYGAKERGFATAVFAEDQKVLPTKIESVVAEIAGEGAKIIQNEFIETHMNEGQIAAGSIRRAISKDGRANSASRSGWLREETRWK